MQSWVLAERGIHLSGAWYTPIGIGAYQWQWGVMVAVYGVHLLLLGLIGGVWAYGGCWRPPGAVRAGWWEIGMAWPMVVPGTHLARRVLAALGVCVGYM